MKNVLLLVHDDPGQEARLQAALDLVRALRGHLTCLDVAVVPAISGEFDGAYALSLLMEEEHEREAANRNRLQDRLGREDVPWTWIDVTAEPADALQRAAGLADLIVVNRKLEEPSTIDMRATASEVAIKSGRTVVAVPEDAQGFETAGHAMVAWDGSAEAMNALQAAIPLLQLARLVSIVEVVAEPIETPAAEAAAYLSRHGIAADVVRRRSHGEPTADVLLAEAKAEGASYVVMGAFGRPRLVEAVFGGVAREMLTESPIPVVTAH